MPDLSDLITVVVHNPSHDMNVFLGGFFDFKRQGISTLREHLLEVVGESLDIFENVVGAGPQFFSKIVK